MLAALAVLERRGLTFDCNGPERLPARFEQLLGSVRRLTIRGRSREQVVNKLQELVLLHTIGHWSHWAVRLPAARPPPSSKFGRLPAPPLCL